MFTTTTAAERLDDAQDDLLARMTPACAACDDLVCLDCADGTDHDRCVRPCVCVAALQAAGDMTGVGDAVAETDWDAAWEATRLITELRGLDRVDRAIRALPTP